MMLPTLREGRSDDRPFLLEVLKLSALATYPALARLGRISLRETLEVFYAEYDLPSKRIWIAELDGTPAAGLWGLSTIHPALEEAELLIVAIATLPEQRGHGLAKALLAHAAREAAKDGAKSLRLFANPENPAMELYRAEGFQPLTLELRKPLG